MEDASEIDVAMDYGQGSSYKKRGKRQWSNSSWKQQDRSNTDMNRSRNDGNFGNHFHSSKSQRLVVHIDTGKVGKLIGKGGSKIRELQEKSNARINIDKSNGNDVTPVTLIGSEEAQQKAKELIDELLNDSSFTVQNKKPQCNIDDEIDFSKFDWVEASKEHDILQKEKWAEYPPIIKNFYKEDPAVTNMSMEYVSYVRKINNNIEVKYVFENEEDMLDERTIPNPIETFEQAFSNYPDILNQIRKQGFEKPSPIQCQAWPILLSGKDLIGIAQTGTGKTLAFLMPALIHIDGQETPRSQRAGPNVLIMAPTRELALQIENEVEKYPYRGIKVVCLYGGGSRKDQVDIVTSGVQIVIATPGRLNDLVDADVLDLSCITYIVLDEADRMLDMGFEPQIRKTLSHVRPDRQTVMTSATWPPGVRRLAQSYMKNPIEIFVGSLDLTAVHTVTQKIYIVDEDEKTDMMYQFFRGMGPNDKVIVFFGKKARVDNLASDLALKGVDCQSIHGGREQWDRQQALADLKSGDVKILLATDVASRGIDIEDISHVFNYDFPRDIEEYVHRVGRTGRAGRTGESITLMTRKDWSHAKHLISILEEANQEIPKELYRMAQKHDVWKEKRAQEKEIERLDSRGYSGSRRGGGRQGGNSHGFGW